MQWLAIGAAVAILAILQGRGGELVNQLKGTGGSLTGIEAPILNGAGHAAAAAVAPSSYAPQPYVASPTYAPAGPSPTPQTQSPNPIGSTAQTAYSTILQGWAHPPSQPAFVPDPTPYNPLQKGPF